MTDEALPFSTDSKRLSQTHFPTKSDTYDLIAFMDGRMIAFYLYNPIKLLACRIYTEAEVYQTDVVDYGVTPQPSNVNRHAQNR